jgi:predicted aspartyl protease
MIAYSTVYEPPAPILSVTVASTRNRRLRQTLNALIDTGSDITAVPVETVERLRLYAIRRLQFEDLHGNTSILFTYKVRLTIGDLAIPELEVIPTGLETAIIGRDLLNRYDLHLYGPRQVFEITV